MFHRLTLLLAIAVSITGCVSSQKIEIPPGKLASIKTIAVNHIPELPPELEVARDVSGGPALFGAVGAIVIMNAQMNDRPGWSATIVEQIRQLVTANSKVHLSNTLEQSIVSQLQSRGIESRITETRADPNADATLVVSYKFYGFINDRKVEEVTTFDPSKLVNVPKDRIYLNNYHPALWVTVDMLGKNGSEILYRGFHASGWKPPKNKRIIPNWFPVYDDWTYTPLPEPVTFGSVEEFAANPQKIMTAFRAAAEAVATSIVKDIANKGVSK